MTKETSLLETKNIYEELSKPLPKEGIQRSKTADTRKGYDTTGYGYQYIVNRFNEVLGIGGWNWNFVEMERAEGTYKSGQKFYSITGGATITIYLEAEKNKVCHTEFGGHQSSSITDALKGASTNALKKSAAFFGVGKDAFEGTVDEDNSKQPEIKVHPVIDYEAKLKAVKNLKGLESVWASLPVSAKTEFKGLKDLLKIEFTANENN